MKVKAYKCDICGAFKEVAPYFFLDADLFEFHISRSEHFGYHTKSVCCKACLMEGLARWEEDCVKRDHAAETAISTEEKRVILEGIQPS